MSRTQQ